MFPQRHIRPHADGEPRRADVLPPDVTEQVRRHWQGTRFADPALHDLVLTCMTQLRAEGAPPEVALVMLKELLAYESGNSLEVAERRRVRQRLVSAAIEAYYRAD